MLGGLAAGALAIGAAIWLAVRTSDPGATHGLAVPDPAPERKADRPAADLETPPVAESARGEQSQTATAAVASPANPDVPRPFVQEPPSIQALAKSIRNDMRLLKEFRLFVTAEAVVNKAVFLREDALNKSYEMPFPPGLDIRDFHVTFSGPNGTRLYTFKRDEYPLFAWFQTPGNSKTEYGAQVDAELLDKVLAFAEESLQMVP